jgi:Ca-activated chloride channel family protein
MSFGSPLLLATLLVVPAALALLVVLRRRSTRYAVSFPNLAVLGTVVAGSRSWRRAVPLVALLAALTSLSVALARPHVTLSLPTERATVLLVLDTSRSMLSDDVRPTRLEAAKTAARRFMRNVPDRLRVGLITFSGDVTVTALPTQRHEEIVRSIASISPYSGFGGGTAIGDAVARAVEVGTGALAEDGREAPTPQELRRLVTVLFLSDGRQNRGVLSPLEGAARAEAAGIPVHTVALGTMGGGTSGGFFGGGRRSPDPETLQAIAKLTGGEFTWSRTAKQLSEAYEDLGSRVGRTPQRTEVTVAFVAAAAVALLGAAVTGTWWSPRLP